MNLLKVESRELAESAFLDARNSNSDLYVAFIDINGLKLVNDVFGHAQGDILIQALSGAFKKYLTPEERVFRFGGDEFLILLNSRSRAEFLKLAISLETTMQELAAITVAGLAVGVVKESSYVNFSELLAGVDALMYEAKLNGQPLIREDRVSTETVRRRDPKSIFQRDYFTAILKTVLQTHPELKNKKGVMEDVRAFWNSYQSESFEHLSPAELIEKLVKHLPVERKKPHATQKSN